MGGEAERQPRVCEEAACEQRRAAPGGQDIWGLSLAGLGFSGLLLLVPLASPGSSCWR